MTADNIEIKTGTSWLRDTQMSRLVEREEFLKDAMSRGLPYHEYIGFVGRHRECLRQQQELSELFIEFSQAEDIDDDDGLKELKDE